MSTGRSSAIPVALGVDFGARRTTSLGVAVAVFISYARDDRPAVETLRRHIETPKREVWLDEKLTGGQKWWDTILSRIRDCDVFLYALSLDSLDSRACQAELGYAQDLGRPILPVMVAPVAVQLAPRRIAEMQIVDYTTPTPDTPVSLESALSLRNALDEMPAAGELPDPLPDPPPVPISYMDRERELIDGEELSYAEQTVLVAKLRALLDRKDDRPVAIELLKKLRKRPDVAQQVVRDIDALLVDVAPHKPPPVVRPAPRLSAELHPEVGRSRAGARFELEARNHGGTRVTATLAVTQESGALSLEVHPGTMNVAPGATNRAAVRVKPRAPVLVGGSRKHPVRVAIGSAGSDPLVAEATFVQEPWVRPWQAIGGLLVAMVLVAVVLVWLMRGPSPPQPTRGRSQPSQRTTLSWDSLAPPETTAKDAVMSAVAAVPEGGGYVAGGKDGTDAAVWRSRDGRTWDRISSDDLDGENGSLSVGAIIVPNPDLTFAIGKETSAEGDKDVAVWRSEGGEESAFQRLPDELLEGEDDQVATCARGTPPEKGVGVLIGGFEGAPGSRVASIWNSTTQGDAWEQLSVMNPTTWDEARINRIICLPAESCDLFLAVGSSTQDGSKDATVWTSTTGREWVPSVISADGDQGMTDATVFDSMLVAVGFDRSGAHGGAAVWTSSDGTDWSRVPDPEGTLEGPDFVANNLSAPNFEGPPGLIAVGQGREVDSPNHDALVWTSEDGLRWFRESDPNGAFGGPGDQEIRGIAARDDFPVIAVGLMGLDDEDPAIWIARPLPA